MVIYGSPFLGGIISCKIAVRDDGRGVVVIHTCTVDCLTIAQGKAVHKSIIGADDTSPCVFAVNDCEVGIPVTLIQRTFSRGKTTVKSHPFFHGQDGVCIAGIATLSDPDGSAACRRCSIHSTLQIRIGIFPAASVRSGGGTGGIHVPDSCIKMCCNVFITVHEQGDRILISVEIACPMGECNTMLTGSLQWDDGSQRKRYTSHWRVCLSENLRHTLEGQGNHISPFIGSHIDARSLWTGSAQNIGGWCTVHGARIDAGRIRMQLKNGGRIQKARIFINNIAAPGISALDTAESNVGSTVRVVINFIGPIPPENAVCHHRRGSLIIHCAAVGSRVFRKGAVRHLRFGLVVIHGAAIGSGILCKDAVCHFRVGPVINHCTTVGGGIFCESTVRHLGRGRLIKHGTAVVGSCIFCKSAVCHDGRGILVNHGAAGVGSCIFCKSAVCYYRQA